MCSEGSDLVGDSSSASGRKLMCFGLEVRCIGDLIRRGIGDSSRSAYRCQELRERSRSRGIGVRDLRVSWKVFAKVLNGCLDARVTTGSDAAFFCLIPLD